MKNSDYLKDVGRELKSAEAKFPPFNSYHEGYAIIKEELDELWGEVKSKNRNLLSLYTEARQVAAMAVRFMKLVTEKYSKLGEQT